MDKQVAKAWFGSDVAPKVLKIFPLPKDVEHLGSDFLRWLECYVIAQKPDTASPSYGRQTNPLVLSAVDGLKVQTAIRLIRSPFVFIDGNLSNEDFLEVVRLMEVAIREHHGSFRLNMKLQLRLVHIEDPAGHTEFQELLFQFAGGLGFLTPQDSDEEVVARAFATFYQGRPELIAQLVLSTRYAWREARGYRNQLPDDD